MKKGIHPIPNIGDMVEITARRCSGKVSPLLQVGTRLIVKGVGRLQDATPVLELSHPSRKRAILRANAQRFDWRILTAEILEEEAFQKECRESAEQLNRDFTQQEQLKIAVLPLILNHIAWVYAFKAVEKSVEYRVSLLKKLTRSIRELQKEYRYQISRDLDSLHIRTIEEQTELFLQSIANDMTIFYFTINREFKKKMPIYPFDDLRTYAIMAIIILQIAEMHTKEMDELIRQRLGQCKQTIQHPIMQKLKFCMEAMAGEVGKFDYEEYNVTLCKGIFRKNINKIDFNFV